MPMCRLWLGAVGRAPTYPEERRLWNYKRIQGQYSQFESGFRDLEHHKWQSTHLL
jgi:hypothetical protein